MNNEKMIALLEQLAYMLCTTIDVKGDLKEYIKSYHGFSSVQIDDKEAKQLLSQQKEFPNHIENLELMIDENLNANQMIECNHDEVTTIMSLFNDSADSIITLFRYYHRPLNISDKDKKCDDFEYMINLYVIYSLMMMDKSGWYTDDMCIYGKELAMRRIMDNAIVKNKDFPDTHLFIDEIIKELSHEVADYNNCIDSLSTII